VAPQSEKILWDAVGSGSNDSVLPVIINVKQWARNTVVASSVSEFILKYLNRRLNITFT